MRFGILGPLEVTVGDQPRRPRGRKQRTLLATLLVQPNEVVSTDQLASALWSDTRTDTSLNALHTHVSRLRAQLDAVDEPGDHRVVRHGAGYLIRVQDDELDAAVFEDLSRRALDALAAGAWPAALAAAEAALARWRGPALEEFDGEEFARARVAQLEEQRLVTIECRVDAALALGRHRELVSDLQELVTRHPLRESLWCQLMLALYRSGRQGDALRAYERVRWLLADELGIKPGTALQRLERAVLDQDPALDWQETHDAQEAQGVDGPGPDDGAAPARLAADNLPRQPTSFVGRRADRAMVAAALERSRLVTLSGSGGCGKTRLALAVAEDVRDRFPDGVWFVDLAAVTAPALVARAITRPLGVETDLSSQLDYVCRRIGDARLLLVLDNCEHLRRAVAGSVERVLERCDSVRILATSRTELGVAAEFACRVPALSLPLTDHDDHHESFLSSEAVQLFVARSRARIAGFSPAGDALDEVALICQQLDGMPLAIEVAAARVGDMPVADIAERLDDRLRLAAEGRRWGLPRSRTLQTALDWSFDLLDEQVKQLFIRLGVFVGDFTVAAAEAVAPAGTDRRAVVRALEHLVSRALAQRVGTSAPADRYRLLEAVRHHVRERLDRLGLTDEVGRQHACHYAQLATQAEQGSRGPAVSTWLARILSELPNLRTAVTWCLSHDLEAGMRLASSLRYYLPWVGLLDEADEWFQHGLANGRELRPDTRLLALTAAGTVAVQRGDVARMRQLGEDAVALARALGDEHELARALIVRGWAFGYEGELERAAACFEEAVGLAARFRTPATRAWALVSWGVTSLWAGRHDQGRRQLEDALALFRSLDDVHGQVLPLTHLALGAVATRRPVEARSLATEATEIADRLRDPQLQHVSLYALGEAELALGRPDAARDRFLSSVRLFPGARSPIALKFVFRRLAELAADAGRYGDAVALVGFTRQLQETSQLPATCSFTPERRLLDAARATIGAEGVQYELGRGRAIGLDEAVCLAESATDALPRTA